MALLHSFPSHFQLLEFLRNRASPNSSVLETAIPPSIFPLVSLASSPARTKLGYPSLQPLRCRTSSTSSIQQEYSPSTKIFIKGLPQSTSEGRLKRAFSEYGEVSQVQLIADGKSGFAFIWFTSEDSAELAVKEMNGKFFDGRFVYVTIAKPGSPKARRRPTMYKF